MGNVMVIPAKRQVGNTVKQSEQKKLRVAAYCRVSTDSDEQETSYEAQVTHYTEYIQKNPDWELAGIFADDGISGTNTKKRDEFNRMIDECMSGNIDMIKHSRLLREGVHKHAGCQRRGAPYDHGEPCSAGKPINEREHKARPSIPLSAGQGSG